MAAIGVNCQVLHNVFDSSELRCKPGGSCNSGASASVTTVGDWFLFGAGGHKVCMSLSLNLR